MTTPDIETPVDEEPVDETADQTRLHPQRTGLFGYMLLTPTDRHALRMERAHGLEADLFRVELALEEAIDNVEREALSNRADQLLRRIRLHMDVLSTALPERSVPDPPQAVEKP